MSKRNAVARRADGAGTANAAGTKDGFKEKYETYFRPPHKGINPPIKKAGLFDYNKRSTTTASIAGHSIDTLQDA